MTLNFPKWCILCSHAKNVNTLLEISIRTPDGNRSVKTRVHIHRYRCFYITVNYCLERNGLLKEIRTQFFNNVAVNLSRIFNYSLGQNILITLNPHWLAIAHTDMCCDLVGWVGSREHWLWDIPRKRNEFLLFSITIILEPLVRFMWGFHYNVPLLMRTLIKSKTENVIHVCATSDWFP